MSTMQARIILAMTCICFVVNLAAVASAFWRDSELEKAGISIEQILQEGRR